MNRKSTDLKISPKLSIKEMGKLSSIFEENPEIKAIVEAANIFQERPELSAMAEAARLLRENPVNKVMAEATNIFQRRPEMNMMTETARLLQESPTNKAMAEAANIFQERPELSAMAEAARLLRESPVNKAMAEATNIFQKRPEMNMMTKAVRLLQESLGVQALTEATRIFQESSMIKAMTEAADIWEHNSAFKSAIAASKSWANYPQMNEFVGATLSLDRWGITESLTINEVLNELATRTSMPLEEPPTDSAQRKDLDVVPTSILKIWLYIMFFLINIIANWDTTRQSLVDINARFPQTEFLSEVRNFIHLNLASKPGDIRLVTGKNVRLREGPGMKYGVLLNLPRDAIVVVLEKTNKDWLYVSYEHQGYIIDGYVSVNLLKKVRK